MCAYSGVISGADRRAASSTAGASYGRSTRAAAARVRARPASSSAAPSPRAQARRTLMDRPCPRGGRRVVVDVAREIEEHGQPDGRGPAGRPPEPGRLVERLRLGRRARHLRRLHLGRERPRDRGAGEEAVERGGGAGPVKRALARARPLDGGRELDGLERGSPRAQHARDGAGAVQGDGDDHHRVELGGERAEQPARHQLRAGVGDGDAQLCQLLEPGGRALRRGVAGEHARGGVVERGPQIRVAVHVEGERPRRGARAVGGGDHHGPDGRRRRGRHRRCRCGR